MVQGSTAGELFHPVPTAPVYCDSPDDVQPSMNEVAPLEDYAIPPAAESLPPPRPLPSEVMPDARLREIQAPDAQLSEAEAPDVGQSIETASVTRLVDDDDNAGPNPRFLPEQSGLQPRASNRPAIKLKLKR